VEALWEQLASDDPQVACESYLRLTSLRDDLIPFLAERLPQPPDDPRRIEGLVQKLASRDYQERTRAAWSLVQLGDLATVPLDRAIERGLKREARSRATDVLEKIRKQQNHVSLEVVRAMRAMRMLEHVGTEAARGFLLAFAKNRLESASVIDARLVVWRVDYLTAR
jgi:HEAT repeat protein